MVQRLMAPVSCPSVSKAEAARVQAKAVSLFALTRSQSGLGHLSGGGGAARPKGGISSKSPGRMPPAHSSRGYRTAYSGAGGAGGCPAMIHGA